MELIENLEMYASSGLPIVKALELVGHALVKKRRESIVRAYNAVEAGQMLSPVLSKEVGISDAIAGLISCGEESGRLGESLRVAHAIMTRQDELIKKCLSAMTYPTIIGLATVALTIGLMRGIMPQIIPLLSGLHTDLPLLTKITIASSNLMGSYGIYILAGLVTASISVSFIYRKLNGVRSIIQKVVLEFPILGGVIRSYALAIFFQSLGALVESGMNVDLAYESASMAVSLLPLRRSLMSKIDNVRHGEAMSLSFNKDMPPYISPLIAAGEASGRLGQSLGRAAHLIDRELDHSLKKLTSLIEPIMMIGMGCIVGSVALSIMMPIYDISRALQK